MSTWSYMNIIRQGHSLTLVQGHLDSTFSNFFMHPTSKKLQKHIGFGLSVRLCIHSKTVYARVLKFYIWIPNGKIADTYFSCLSYLPFWSYTPLKQSEWNLMHAVSYEPCMLGFWNFIYGFLMENSYMDSSWKRSWPLFIFFSCPSYLPLWSYPLWKNQNGILSANLEKYLS